MTDRLKANIRVRLLVMQQIIKKCRKHGTGNWLLLEELEKELHAIRRAIWRGKK